MPFCVQGKLEAKAPFSQYSSLSGANIVYGSPTDTSSYPSDQFDIVYDNNGKDLDTCKVAIDHFKVCIYSCYRLMQLSDAGWSCHTNILSFASCAPTVL